MLTDLKLVGEGEPPHERSNPLPPGVSDAIDRAFVEAAADPAHEALYRDVIRELVAFARSYRRENIAGLLAHAADSGHDEAPGAPREFRQEEGMGLPARPLPTEGERPQTESVAGRIDAPANPLVALAEEWLTALSAKGRTFNTIEMYRRLIARVIRETGWARPDQLTYSGLVAWLSQHPRWTPATYNSYLVCLRSFTRHLCRARVLAADPLAEAEKSSGEHGEGSRAATLQEARAHLSAAALIERVDGRRKAPTALYYLCLYAAGCRAEEPTRWLWSDLHLDVDPASRYEEDRVPHLVWRPTMHKNKRRVVVALAPELAAKLRERHDLLKPQPGDRVFPGVPPRNIFAADRERAGIELRDRQGLPYTPHSARKFLSTELTRQGVAEKMVDFLMRHRGRPEHRYYKPTLTDQWEALLKLPRLWPGDSAGPDTPVPNTPPDSGDEKDFRKNVQNTVDSRDGIADTPGATSEITRDGRFEPESPHAAARGLCPGVATAVIGRAAASVDSQVSALAGFGRLVGHASIGAITPTSTPVGAPDLGALADLLESVARLLRGAGGDERHRGSRAG